MSKLIRWYYKVATKILLGTAAVNALIIYNSTIGKKLKITEFREALVNEVLEFKKHAESPKEK